MHFKEVKPNQYQGQVEPGKNCLVPRNNTMTYLVSEVEFDEKIWISRDRGFDPKTHEQLWGSKHGPLHFQRIVNLGDHLNESWLRSASH